MSALSTYVATEQSLQYSVNKAFVCFIRDMYLAQTSIRFCRVWEQLKRRSSFQVLPTMDNQRKTSGASRELNHPAFQNIRICLVSVDICAKSPLYRNHRRTTLQTENANGIQQPMTVVTLSKLITPQAMQQCLQFIYTGSLDKRYHDLQVRWVDRNYRKRKGILENVRSLPFSFHLRRQLWARTKKQSGCDLRWNDEK